jgi:prepilin-type N-terminal cleavage/methylation domain-containing protein
MATCRISAAWVPTNSPAEKDLRPTSATGNKNRGADTRVCGVETRLDAIFATGRQECLRHVGGERGVTLIEMMVVVTIIAVIVGITTPSVSAGIDAIRLATATSSVAAFVNSASTHAERRERPVELVISAHELLYISTDPGSKHELKMPEGITLEPVSAQPSEDAEGNSRWLFLPGGAVPSVTIRLSNKHGGKRLVKLDPMTGFPRVEDGAAQ